MQVNNANLYFAIRSVKFAIASFLAMTLWWFVFVHSDGFQTHRYVRNVFYTVPLRCIQAITALISP
jgi:hypothetical protein